MGVLGIERLKAEDGKSLGECFFGSVCRAISEKI